MKILALISVIFFVSCTAPVRKTEVTTIKSVTVYVVPWTQNMPRVANRYKVLGAARGNNEIFVLGRIVKGKIVVNDTVLGHELRHLLHRNNHNFANPDD